MSNSPHRSFEKIERVDLLRVLDLATQCLEEMLSQNETGRFYSIESAMMACLCQGAANHFVHGNHSIQDWDAVFFFRTNPNWKFPRDGEAIEISDHLSSAQTQTMDQNTPAEELTF